MVRVRHGAAGDVADDTLEARIAELSELELLVSSIEACGNQLMSAVSQLQSAPLPLVEKIGCLYTRESACGVLLSRLGDNLKACKFRFAGVAQNLEGLAELVEQVQPRIASAKGAVAAHRAAWTAKLRAEREADTVTAADRREASALYDRATREAALALDSLLSQRWPIAGTAVTRFCGCYDEILRDPSKLAGEPRKRPATGEPRASSGDHRLGWTGSTSRTCGALGCFVAPQKSLDGLNDFVDPKSSTSTGDTATPPSAESSRELCATEDNHFCQGVYRRSARRSLGGPGERPGSARDDEWCPDQDPAAAPPPPPLWTVPHEEEAEEKRFSTGDRVRVWSSSKKKWLEGVVKNVFRSPGSWDSYAVPAGVIQVESNIGVKFIQPEEARVAIQPAEKPGLQRGVSMSL
mmetsp:Transcript_66885/g.188336  ORF Transcript_66885/g.188336 Transcript_66885/m.188336 type:complete len:408 (-) Transcript_66885:114-1337(-)